jgi:polyhydroxybutyrate depolymerase
VSTRVPLVALGVLVTAVAACGGASSQGAHKQAQPGCPSAGRHAVDGGFYKMPSGARPGRTPLLVVVMPSGNGDTTDRLGLARAGNRQGVAVLYPTSKGGGFWTLNNQQGRQDVDDVTALLDRVTATGCFDADRISITGVSNGAGFATRMACELPTRFAALAPVAAGYRALDPCPAEARASFLAIHGTADTVVPYNGKKPDRKGSVPRFTARWAKRVGCSSRPRTSRPQRLVTRYTYRGCDAGRRVELVRVTGTDHGWPGNKGRRLPSRNPSGFKSTPEVLRFILAARRGA